VRIAGGSGRIRKGLGLAAVVVLAIGGLAACVPAPHMNVTAQQPGVDIPWDLGWLPNGTMIFTERGNGISVVVNGQRRNIWKPADLVVAIEAGMMSIAVDPGFNTTRDVFVCFASTQGGAADVRISRVTLNADLTGITSRTDILTGAPVNPIGELGRHSGCRMRFGPDGYLWVGTGDAAIGTAPQDPHSLGGKVLRIQKNGFGAPGNMGAPFDPRIYNYGHRNVQGIAFRSNGQAFAVEHGPGCDDEVNLLSPGANYGWDPTPRVARDPSYNENVPMTDTARYPKAFRASYSTGCPTIAPSGGTFVSGSRWGAWNGGLVLAVLKGAHLRMIRLSIDGLRTTAISVAVANHGRLRTDIVGPDGALYVTTSNGSGRDAILRIVPSSVTS
jgi:glucose/arabinose dehydrogenase